MATVAASDRYLSTTGGRGPDAWAARVDPWPGAGEGLRAVPSVLASARGRRAVVLQGGSGAWAGRRETATAALLARRRRPPAVVVAEAAWKPRGPLERLVKRAGLRAIDGPHVRYCVLAAAERERFAATWGVPAARVAFTPYATTWTDAQLAPAGPGDGRVFAGGDALRDYRPLLAASPGVDADVTIATRRLPPCRAGRLTVAPLPHAEYVARLRASSVVVVALADGTARSAGQQTYLNAMATGRVVVVPDVLGVRDYVTDGVDGLVVPPGDPRALAAALRWALDPDHAEAVAAMGARAAATVRARFTPEHHARALLAVADRAVLELAA